MARQNHQIRKLSWQIDDLEPDQVDEVTGMIGSWTTESLLPVLSERLDQIIPAEHTVFIPDLKIDLTLHDWHPNSDFVEQIVDALIKKVNEEKYIKNIHSTPDQISEYLAHASKKDQRQDVLENQLSTWKAFEVFLQSGILPWWWEGSLPELEAALLMEASSKKTPRLTTPIKPVPNFLHRLESQFSSHFFQRYRSSLRTTQQLPVTEFILLTRKLLEDTNLYDAQTKKRRHIIELLSVWIPQIGNLSELSIAPHLLKFVFGDELEQVLYNYLDHSQKKATPKKASHRTNVKRILCSLDTLPPFSKKEAIEKDYSSQSPKEHLEKIAAEATSDPKNIRPDSEEKSFDEVTESATKEGIFASDAGLVILHPFLLQYFTELGLLDYSNHFRSADAHQRAVHHLYYLAHEIQDPTEDLLTVGKLLCGYPPELSITRAIYLTEAEQQKSEELLRAVLTHWKALKNTSVSGLREAFLSRNGKITWKENHIEMDLEQHPSDVLLTKLPWGLSPVVLPWLELPIFVNWV